MAKTNAASRVASTRNPFMGKSVAEMKKIYDEKYRGKGLSAAKLSKVADQMQAAKKSLPTAKTKPAAKKAAPKAKPKAKPSKAAASRFYSSSSGGPYSTGKDRFYSSSSGATKSTPKKRTVRGRAVRRRK